MEEIKELEKIAEEIYEKCRKVYGNCRDGSFEASLHSGGYYEVKRIIKEIRKKELEEQ